jgi:hypothetical protein
MPKASKDVRLQRGSSGGCIARPRTGAALAVGLITFLGWVLQAQAAPNNQEGPAAAGLAKYRAELQAFRAEFGGARELPETQFFLFGMGQRAKLLYKADSLVNATTGKLLRQWPVKTVTIVPPAYCVSLTTASGSSVRILEDEQAVWIEEKGARRAVDGTEHPVRLPDFKEYRYPQVLRVLHQELLVNIIDGKPVPNFFVYPKPWYRDGAMMAMCYKATDNLNLIRDWVLGLTEPYDRNNSGETEADNLGQALYLVSLVADKNHPLVAKVLKEMPRFEVDAPGGKYLKGRSDFAFHSAYQTKWAKYGLRALGLPDAYVVPRIEDSYSALFWMDYRETYVKSQDAGSLSYPYLNWACDHFHNLKRSPISNRDYPLTWEKNASAANYSGMTIISEEYRQQRLAAPHTWHAAEVFLYLLEQKAK